MQLSLDELNLTYDALSTLIGEFGSSPNREALKARVGEEAVRVLTGVTESRTVYVIQMWTELYGRGWTDVDGQLTDGYPTLDAARAAFPKIRDWDAYKGVHGEVKVRIVERTVTETVREI